MKSVSVSVCVCGGGGDTLPTTFDRGEAMAPVASIPTPQSLQFHEGCHGGGGRGWLSTWYTV